MKRFISVVFALTLFTICAFAATSQGDEYFDDYNYEQNDAGDQFIKFSLNGLFPLNFDGHLYTGGAINVGYYKFIGRKLAVGGEGTLSYNVSLGIDILYMAPFTFGVMYQPEIGKFEFPLTAGIGVGFESWANMMYFPAPTIKASAGAYYRITEGFSAGVEGTFLCLPQWTKTKEENFTALFATAAIGIRFHF